MKKKNLGSKEKINRYSREMYIGLFLLFPAMFFGEQVKGSYWYTIFGITALIGSVIIIFNFIKILREPKNKKVKKTIKNKKVIKK